MAKAEASTPLVLAPRGADSTLRKHLINVLETGLIWILLKALKPDTKPTAEEIEAFSSQFRIHAIYKAGKPRSKTSASVQPIEANISGRGVTVWNLEINGGADSEEMLKGTSKAAALFVWKTLYGKEGGSPQQQIKNRGDKAVAAYLKIHPEFRENLKTLIKSQKFAEPKGASTVTFRILGGDAAETSFRILKDDQKSYLALVTFASLANGTLYIEDSKKQMKVPENTSLVALKTLFVEFVPEASFVPVSVSEDSDSDETFVPDYVSEALAATA